MTFYHKFPVIILIFLLCINSITAQVPNFEWVKQIEASSGSESSLTTDNQGNIYTIGGFRNTVDFDPGIGVFNLTSSGGLDIFIQKLDNNGNFLWAKSIGGSGTDDAYSIAIDNDGNIYTTGYFSSIVDFDPGSAVFNLTNVAFSDAYILKIDANGNFIWAKQIGGNSGDWGRSIITDTTGNVYTAGYFRNTVDFDPGVGVFNLTSIGTDDSFIQKLDANGNFQWAKQINASISDFSRLITNDVYGNIYLTGLFQGTVDFDPGTGVSNLSSGGTYDIFIQKLNTNGVFVWVKQMKGTSGSSSICHSIESDKLGNIYFTGAFQGTVDFDPGFAIDNKISAGNDDFFIEKMDTSGNLVWVNIVGGTSNERGNSVDLDDSGNIYTTGRFYNTIDFDPGTGVSNLSSIGNSDIFIQKLDNSGNFQWAVQMGGTGSEVGLSINIDISGNILTTGGFQSIVDFDPGIGLSNLTSSGGNNFYILKLNQCVSSSADDIITACDSITWIDGITYYSNNSIAKDTLINNSGCDSIVSLNLTLNNSNTSSTNQTSCDSFTWNGTSYTTSGIYTATSTNSAGCDSIATLNLTINNSTTSSTNQTSCDSFTWNGTSYTTSGIYTATSTNSAGCDSIATLNLTINNSTTSNTSQTSCDSFTWNGTSYTTSGIYTATSTNSAGCDSIATLNLTINNSTTSNTSQTSCDSFTWNGTSYTTSGIYTATSTNSAGCDSIATLNLTINNSTTSNTSQTSCDSFTWNGTSYTTSGIYTATSTNSAGCDSIATLNLTINNSTTSNTSQTSCDSFTWNGTSYTTSGIYTATSTNSAGCDSIATLNLTINNSTTSNTSQTSCDSFTWNGTSYTTSGIYTATSTNSAGCDSIATLNLTINNSTTSSTNQTSCDSFTWNGTSYTTSGIYTATSTNSAGCDSIATLNLTINNSTTSNTSQTSCDSFTWNGTSYTTSGIYTATSTNSAGCDSIATLNLTINNSTTSNTSQTSCDSFTWNGTSYTTSGIYTATSTNSAGCDSTATLNLTINTISDLSTSLTGSNITANIIGADYQWLDCDNSYSLISNEINSSFIAIQNGNYAVEITEGGCIDTSACVSITTVGIEDISTILNFSVYPNPSMDFMLFDLGEQFENIRLELYNVTGELMHQTISTNNNKIKLDRNQLATGSYFFKIVVNGNDLSHGTVIFK